MSDDLLSRQQQVLELQEDLKKGLSRRNFLDRLKGLGIGFGAAAALVASEAEARSNPGSELTLKSSNAAIDDIAAEGQQDLHPEGKPVQVARRFFRRFYRRFGGYRRFFYRRFYRRGYRRFFYRRF
jgi:hypothetical protein